MEYTKEQINEALAAGSREAGYRIVPSRDLSGHGTEVLGIAAGNGQASGGQYRGVASKSDILVVKIGTAGSEFAGTVELMLALDYVIRKAMELGKPVAINLSFGKCIWLACAIYQRHSWIKQKLKTILQLNNNSMKMAESVCYNTSNESFRI